MDDITGILCKIWLASAILMFIVWLIQIKTKDASYVDVAWSAAIGCAAIYGFINYSLFDIRHWLIFLCPLFWSLRLTYYLTSRLLYLKEEDSRYQSMRVAMADKAIIGFFIFFQVQALFIVIFSAPILISLSTSLIKISWLDIIGFLIFILALVGESIADKQLLDFKKNHGSNQTCKIGLWQYSRHPNYFFEWLHWFAYAAFSISSPYFVWSMLMPFLMLFFIVKLTGIPHVEREAMRKKPDYADYKAQTPMIFLDYKTILNDFFKK